MATQDLVITKFMDLKKGENSQHYNFRRSEPRPFEEKDILGSGAFRQINKVLSLINFKEYARKRINQKIAFG